jgi:release factor glutamine methyltransferase
VDISQAALAVARENAENLGLSARARLEISDWCAGINEKFEIVVANPPYIASNEVSALMPEVARFEPHLALDGGADGLSAYRKLAGQLPPHLADNALIAVESGLGQHEAIIAIFGENGFRMEAVACDLAGIARCVIFRK